MNARMQGLDPTAQHLGCPGHVRNERHGDASRGERGRGPSRGNDLDSRLTEPGPELDEAGLVMDRNQSPPDRNTGHDQITFPLSTRSRPSTSARTTRG